MKSSFVDDGSYGEVMERLNRIISAYPGFKKYLYNTAWMFAEKILRLIAGLLVGAVVARYLGPDQFGLLNYSISFVYIFSSISTLGLDQIIIRELIHSRKDESVLLGTSFILKIIGALTVLIILWGLIHVLNEDAHTSGLIYVITLGMFFDAFGVIDFFFQSQVKSKYVVWSQMIALTTLSIFRIILLYLDAPLIWFAFAYALDFLILSAGLIFFYSKNSSIFRWSFSTAKAKLLLRHSWPLMIAGLAVGLYVKTDQIMINWMLGNEASGNYGVAVRLSELWYFIPVAICGSLYPSIVNSKLIDENLYQNRLQMLYDLMVTISVLIAIPMTFFSDFIIRILYGEAYSSASSILVIYIWSGVFVFLGVANSKRLVNEGMQVFQMIATSVAALLNIVMNYVLIKKIGLAGAAISTLVSYSFSGYFILLYSRRTRPAFIDCTRSLNVVSLVRRVFLLVK